MKYFGELHLINLNVEVKKKLKRKQKKIFWMFRELDLKNSMKKWFEKAA